MARAKDRRQPQNEPRCAICESRRQGTVELFQFWDELDTYLFHVDTAKRIVADGRAPLPIAGEALRRFAGMSEFDPGHLGHVDPALPGIFTRRFGLPILLDGVHRAVRCFADKQPFHAFELAYEESLECVLQQRVSVKDAAAIVRKLRRVREFFPSSAPVDTPIACAPEVLRQVEQMLSAAERQLFLLRAVQETM